MPGKAIPKHIAALRHDQVRFFRGELTAAQYQRRVLWASVSFAVFWSVAMTFAMVLPQAQDPQRLARDALIYAVGGIGVGLAVFFWERRNALATIAVAADPARRPEIDALVAKAKPPWRLGQFLVFGTLFSAWAAFLLVAGFVAVNNTAGRSIPVLMPVASALPYVLVGGGLLLTRARWLRRLEPLDRDRETLEEHVAVGASAAFLSAGVTAVAAVYGLHTQMTLIDVAVLSGLGIGVLRRSRVCALLLVVYFLLSRCLLWYATQNIRVIVNWQSYTLFCMYLLGVYGTFSLSRRTDNT